ncbi:MAG: hypothetical protein IJH78_04030 [Clostridia bacterium]|nr:hypothetical protein [Clostridia bacterium]
MMEFEHSARFGYGGRNSYAWNDRFLFIANGYEVEGEPIPWVVSHYSLTRLDKKTGNTITLYKDLRGADLDLMISKDKMVMFSQYHSYSNTPGEDGDCTVKVIDFDGNAILPEAVIDLGIFVRDHVLVDDVLYLITEERIFLWDFFNETINCIYKGHDLCNDLYASHVIVYEGKLFFQEEEYIKSLNLNTWQVESITEIDYDENFDKYRFDDRDLPNHWLLIDQSYNYVIVDNIIYHYDHTQKKLWMYDLDNKTTLFTNMADCHFSQFCTDGVVIDIYEPEEQYRNKGITRSFLCPWECFSLHGITYVDEIKELQWKEYGDIVLIENDSYLKDRECICYGDLAFDGSPTIKIRQFS